MEREIDELKNRPIVESKEGVPQEVIDMIMKKLQDMDEKVFKNGEQCLKNEKECKRLETDKFELDRGERAELEIEKLKKKQQSLTKDLQFNVEKLEDDIEGIVKTRIIPLEKEMKSNGDLFLKINQKIQQIEVKLDALAKQLKGLNSKKEPSFDINKFKDIEILIKQIMKEMDDNKAEYNRMMLEVRDVVDTKAEHEEVNLLERKIMEKLNEIVEALVKKFADKQETKQNFKILERQIKNLFELIMAS